MRPAYFVLSLGVALGACVAEPQEGEELATTEQAVLAAPTTVSVTVTAPDRSTVTWSSVTGATKYYVYQQTGTAGTPALIGSVVAPGISLQVARLIPGTEYCFTVATVDSTGVGPRSTSTCGTTLTAPLPPASVVTTPVSETSVRIDWQAVTDATKYYVYRSATIGGSYSYVTTVVAPSLSLTQNNLTPGTHCYKVATVNYNGTSSLSAGHCNTSLQPPTPVTATKLSTGRIRVLWTAVANANRYFVYESRAGAAYTLAASVLSPGISSDRANLTAGVQYCYQVKTVLANNTVSPSSLPPACATP